MMSLLRNIDFEGLLSLLNPLHMVIYAHAVAAVFPLKLILFENYHQPCDREYGYKKWVWASAR